MLYMRALSQTNPKILIPSTITDTVCSVDINGTYYQDNVRINSLQVEGNNIQNLWCISAIINSNIFNILAKITSGNLQGDYVQLNKQFLEPIPFPWKNLINKTEVVSKCISIVKGIENTQFEVIKTNDESELQSLKMALNSEYKKLNDIVENEFYELTEEEKEIVNKYDRQVSYFEMLEKCKR